MKNCLRALLLIAVMTSVASANIKTVDQNLDVPSFLGFVPDRFVVVMKEQIPEGKRQNGVSAASVGVASLDELAKRYSVAAVERQFKGAERNAATEELARYYKVSFSAGDLESAMEAYRKDPNVERVEPIGIHSMFAVPNDGFYDPYQWALNQPNDADIDAPEAWDIEVGQDNTIVAILDSGTRYYHRDLGGGLTSPGNPGAARGNMWINTAELNGSGGVDDDSNGYTDDWIGYDFIQTTSQCWPGEDCSGQDNDPRDFNGHGTHCAGIAGMLTNNGYGMAGVAGGWGNGTEQETGNGVKIMALRMGFSYNHPLYGEVGVVYMDAAAEAFYYAADNGANIASCSWGSSNSGGIAAAATYFVNSGGLIFVAAGNDGSQTAGYLNSRSDCISVSGTDSDDSEYSSTTYGTWVDICAPAVGIYSTYHDHADPNVDYWASLTGTSMACPMAAGVAALIWSQNPSWTASQVESQLYSSADNIDAFLSPAYIGKMGAGRINAYNAVNTGPQPPVAEFSGSPTAGDFPLTVNFTDLSTNTPTSWSWTFGDGGISTAQNPSYEYTAAGTYTVSLTATNTAGSDGETKIDYITVTEPGTGANAYANADLPVSGTVSGSYLNTQSSDNSRESIQERESGGKPANRYSYLEHKWTISVPTSTSLMFFVEGYRNNNSDGDNFTFAYSTNDASYTDLVTINSATEQVYSAAIPNTVSGTVYIRVTDTDRTSGNRSADFVYVDEMYIEYSSAPCTETTPVADFSASITNGQAPLTVNFTDLSTNTPDNWSWTFGDGGSSTAQNPTHNYTSAGTYTVTLTAGNCAGSDAETKVDHITVTAPPGSSMHVHDIVVGRKSAGPNQSGTCTVTINDSGEQPVSGATVFATADGPVPGSFSGVTLADGTVYFETGKIKNPNGEWCFEVTNVTHSTNSYNAGANHVTISCESGDVSSDGPADILSHAGESSVDLQSYPNPFNAGTNITFSLSEGTNVELTIYNVLGQSVRTLVSGYMPEGTHVIQFDGTNDQGVVLGSGMYFSRFQSSTSVATRKMLLLK